MSKCLTRKLVVFILTLMPLFNLFSQEPVFPTYTPMPVKISGVKSNKLNFNGEWKFNPNPGQNFYENINSITWKNIQVPGEWVMQGFTVEKGIRSGYYKIFNIPADWQGQKIILRCDGIYSDAIVYINGKFAGQHQGGFNAFELDVTNLAVTGKENIISIGVESESLSDTLSSASQYAAHQLGGITRKIYLMTVPKVNISGLEISTGFDKSFNNAVLHLKFNISNDSEKDITNILMSCKLKSPQGDIITLSKGEKIISKYQAGKTIEKVIDYNVSTPAKWDAEHPNLYELTIDFHSGKMNETIIKKVGFRQIEIIGSRLFVNGKPVKLRGSNRHEVHPLLGRSLNDELWKKDAQLFKGANCNFIRTSHYPPAEEFIQYCDEIGLYVELENPFCWVGHDANSAWKKSDPQSKNLIQLILSLTAQTVQFYKNHPSIIIWSLANESAWGTNWSEDLKMVNKLDPTRGKTFHDQAYGEYNNYGSIEMPVAVYHYPSPDHIKFTRKFERPILFGEYAHINTYNRQEIAADPGVRDSWGRGFEPFVDDMYYGFSILGGAVWAGIDDIFYLPDGKAVGYGEWGIIDGWRRIKPEYWHMKKSYSPIKLHTTEVPIPLKGDPIKLLIENRFDFTNLYEIKIECSIDGQKFYATTDVPSASSGVITVSPPSKELDGKVMHVAFIDSRNNIIDEYNVQIGKLKNSVLPEKPLISTNLQLIKNGEFLEVKGDKFVWQISNKTGQIIKGQANNKTVLIGGPVFMLLPLTTGPCETDYKLNIEPFNDVCKNWSLTSIESKDSSGTVIVKVKGSYEEAEGSIVYKFNNKSAVEIDYRFISKIDVNPRQWGMVFSVPRDVENLNWKRIGQWNYYPENHIGRTEGKAKPFEDKYVQEYKVGTEPKWEWRYDFNKLGSNDFRATKDDFQWATLNNESGAGIMALSIGKEAFRSFVNGDSINFLIAPFSTGGGDLFFSTHLSSERRPVKKGDILKGEASLMLFDK